MHKSRLAGFIVDCQTDDLAGAAEFWRKALGYQIRPEGSDDQYIEFTGGPDTLHVEVQRVDHPSRVHIDIETDDIEAEVVRLETLGAKRLKFLKRWYLMEAPTGQRFCVVRPQRPDFSDKANRWD